MQYDKYELKIQKIEKFFKMFFRHLGKIIVAVALLMTTAAVLLATRGSITVNAEEMPTQIVYGETPQYEAKAFLSDVTYEYCSVGSENWSEEIPQAPGKYYVRAVAKATFGYRRSAPQEFEIQKKTALITIASSKVAYGSEPSVEAELVYQDRIADVTFRYNENRDRAEVASVVIVDAEGNDVTERYEIATEGRSIYTVPRPVTVEIADAERVYDGTAFSSKDYRITNGSLAEGDHIEISFPTSLTEIGRVRNTAEYKMVNEDGDDVTRHYDITEKVGYLSVVPRKVAIQTESVSKTYNATAVTKEEYSFISELALAEGHTLEINGWASIIDAGAKQNTFDSFRILDRNGDDVTENYRFTSEWGLLQVTPRAITIESLSDEKFYDATALNNQGYLLPNEGELLSNHEIFVSQYTSLTDAGTATNEITCVIRDDQNRNVTQNYAISYKYGTLLVKKIKITVTSKDQTFTYNGSSQRETGFDVTSGTVLAGQIPQINTVTRVTDVGEYANDITIKILQGRTDVTQNYEIDYVSGTLTVNQCSVTVTTGSHSWTYNGAPFSYHEYSENGLVYGHTLKNIVGTSITNVGTATNEFLSYEIYDANGNKVTKNYAVSFENGTLTVTKRQIAVSTESKSKVYDGKPLVAPSWVAVDTTTYHDLVKGHTIYGPTPTGSQTHAGASLNGYVGSTEDIQIYFGEENVTENYEIVLMKVGTLNVSKRPIHTSTNSYEAVYDGKEHSDDTINVIPREEIGGLADGHSFANVKADTFCNVTTTRNIVTFIIVDENGVNVTKNYTVYRSFGTVNITPRPINITTNGYQDVYDGKDHSDNTLNVTNQGTDSGLCEGHELKAQEDVPTFRDVVENQENTFSFEIQCDGTIIDKANYSITFTPGTVTITRRPITVSTDSYDDVYDGFVHSFHTVYVDNQGEKSGLCEDVGHHFDSVSTRSYENVTNGTRNFISFVIVDEDGRSVQSNYQITRNYGTVVIRPRPITVSTESYDDIYDGLDHSMPTVKVENQGEKSGLCLAAKHDFAQISAPIFNEVVSGEENRVSFIIYDYQKSKDVTKNYEITYQYGTVTIKPRPLTVSTEGYDDIYDGLTHSMPTIKVENQGEKSGLCQSAGHEFDNVKVPVFQNVTPTVKNEITFIISNGTSDVTANYEITYLYGDVTIKPRPIVVLTNGWMDIYDGLDHSDQTLTVDNQGEKSGLCLTAGHDFAQVVAPIFNEVTDSRNDVTFIIVDPSGTEVTGNYEITCLYGIVVIRPRPITISTEGYNGIYDGLSHSMPELTVENQGEKSGLCLTAGHTFGELKVPVFKNAIENAKNNIAMTITDGTSDVTGNYDITWLYGDVNIAKKPVHIQTGSQSWTYDGAPHTNTQYQFLDGTSFIGFHTVTIKEGSETYITKVGKVSNEFAFLVFDEEGSPCTENYDIQITEYGTLEVTPRKISIGTASASKPYDGKPLSMPKIYVTANSEDSLLDGDRIEATFTSSLTEVGKIINTFDPDTLKIYCGEEDVTDCYEIDPNYAFGTLEVLESKPGEGGSGGKLDTSGNIGSAPPDGEEEEKEPIPLFVLTTDRTGTLYLKVMSFGDYEGQKWGEATEYEPLILDYASAQYLTAFAMETLGDPANIKILSKYGEYVLPYYASPNNPWIQISDTCVMGDASVEYHLSYFAFDYRYGMTVPEALREFEQEYSRFVQKQYLTIDKETEEYMQTIIAEEGFRKTDRYVIDKVATYIRNAAAYSTDYNRALDQESNIVVAFLSEYQVGICQHYAAAATMLYRAIGIPARYTIGYTVQAEQGVETVVDSSMAHAWVEVYVDGLGWIQVEVTGSSLEDDKPEDKIITIQPAYRSKAYDGTPLTYDTQELIGNEKLTQLLRLGYTYQVVVSGSQTNVGISNSEITEFILYDPNGNPVTDQYEIQKSSNRLQVFPADTLIEIFLIPKDYEYTGKEFRYTAEDVIVKKIGEGLTLKIKMINIALTDVGSLNSAILNENISRYITFEVYAEGSDKNIAHMFHLQIKEYRSGEDYEILRIKPRLLELATLSATKTYDGEPLTKTDVVLSKGYLAEGHQVYLEVIGSQIEQGSSPNTVDKSTFKVYYFDENGEEVDVTSNYTIYREDDIHQEKPCITLGTLTVI